jgi:predicted ATPase with chaperone activity
MLEMLRQLLEDKIVAISRSASSLTYPANFTLIASMNPCPCSYFGDSVKECTCSIAMVKAYQKKISGPLMDRSAKPPLGMGPAEIRKFCPIDETSTNLLKAAM